MSGLARSHLVRTILIQTLVPRQCWPGEENLTDEEWKELERKWAKDEQNDWAKYLKEERNRKARENYQKRKEALNEPIVMPEESKELK